MQTAIKILLSVACATLPSIAGGQAMSIHTTCTTRPGVLAHISTLAGTPIGQIGCCDGQLRCSQFLATTIVVRPPSNHRS